MLKSDTKFFKLCRFSRRISIYFFFQCSDTQTLPAGSRATSCQAGSHWLLLPVCPFCTVGLHHALRDFSSWNNSQCLTFPTCGRLLTPAPTGQRVKHMSGQRALREGRCYTWRNPELGGKYSAQNCPSEVLISLLSKSPFFKELPSYFLFLFTIQRIFGNT